MEIQNLPPWASCSLSRTTAEYMREGSGADEKGARGEEQEGGS